VTGLPGQRPETREKNMPITEPTSLKAAGCCPTLSPCGSCDELDFIYRMLFPTVV